MGERRSSICKQTKDKNIEKNLCKKEKKKRNRRRFLIKNNVFKGQNKKGSDMEWDVKLVIHA